MAGYGWMEVWAGERTNGQMNTEYSIATVSEWASECVKFCCPYLGPEQQLRRAVPERHHNRCVVLEWRAVLPSKPEITNLEHKTQPVNP